MLYVVLLLADSKRFFLKNGNANWELMKHSWGLQGLHAILFFFLPTDDQPTPKKKTQKNKTQKGREGQPQIFYFFFQTVAVFLLESQAIVWLLQATWHQKLQRLPEMQNSLFLCLLFRPFPVRSITRRSQNISDSVESVPPFPDAVLTKMYVYAYQLNMCSCATA